MSAPRVVLDTNVVLSALLFRSGRLSQIRQGWEIRRFVPLVCRQSMAELVRGLGYKKFKLSPTDLNTALAMYMPYVEIHTIEYPTQAIAPVPQCRDPKDQIFLDLAHSAQADFLVTGDEDLLVLNDPLHKHMAFSICTPVAFLTNFIAPLEKGIP